MYCNAYIYLPTILIYMINFELCCFKTHQNSPGLNLNKICLFTACKDRSPCIFYRPVSFARSKKIKHYFTHCSIKYFLLNFNFVFFYFSRLNDSVFIFALVFSFFYFIIWLNCLFYFILFLF